MLLQADSARRQQGLTDSRSRTEGEFRLCVGDFVGVVQANESRYEFSVRDKRHERPTIHGSGVDFSHAVKFVIQLLDALTVETPAGSMG